MDKLVISGGRRLEGQIRVHGSKNAVLPILAATILNGGKNIIHDCPNIKDVVATIDILNYLGCSIEREKNTLIVDSTNMVFDTVPEGLMHEMRSSVVFMGAIVARAKKAKISLPGGCELGPRPIDLHLKALRQLGVQIVESHGYIHCSTDDIIGDDIHLDFPSVGATENIMLAATLAKGTTVITNAAREPEIIDLQNYLNAMGAKISGAGNSVIRIDGVEKLRDVEYTIMPDRIVAGTYLACAAVTGSTLVLNNVCASNVEALLSVLTEMGSSIYLGDNSIVHVPAKRLRSVDIIRTMPYPGFPTDIQSPIMALATVANGTSIFVENIFESRYKQVEELARMGANIKVDGRMAVVRGVQKLTGASVTARDLRGGAALVVAGLAAEGTTEISGITHIDRGYESIEKSLAAIGAKIKRVNI